jgi:hypothetical protein
MAMVMAILRQNKTDRMMMMMMRVFLLCVCLVGLGFSWVGLFFVVSFMRPFGGL